MVKMRATLVVLAVLMAYCDARYYDMGSPYAVRSERQNLGLQQFNTGNGADNYELYRRFAAAAEVAPAHQALNDETDNVYRGSEMGNWMSKIYPQARLHDEQDLLDAQRAEADKRRESLDMYKRYPAFAPLSETRGNINEERRTAALENEKLSKAEFDTAERAENEVKRTEKEADSSLVSKVTAIASDQNAKRAEDALNNDENNKRTAEVASDAEVKRTQNEVQSNLNKVEAAENAKRRDSELENVENKHQSVAAPVALSSSDRRSDSVNNAEENKRDAATVDADNYEAPDALERNVQEWNELRAAAIEAAKRAEMDDENRPWYRRQNIQAALADAAERRTESESYYTALLQREAAARDAAAETAKLEGAKRNEDLNKAATLDADNDETQAALERNVPRNEDLNKAATLDADNDETQATLERKVPRNEWYERRAAAIEAARRAELDEEYRRWYLSQAAATETREAAGREAAAETAKLEGDKRNDDLNKAATIDTDTDETEDALERNVPRNEDLNKAATLDADNYEAPDALERNVQEWNELRNAAIEAAKREEMDDETQTNLERNVPRNEDLNKAATLDADNEETQAALERNAQEWYERRAAAIEAARRAEYRRWYFSQAAATETREAAARGAAPETEVRANGNENVEQTEAAVVQRKLGSIMKDLFEKKMQGSFDIRRRQE